MPAADIRVTLPDGSPKVLPAGSTGADLARAIGPGLAKAAVAVTVNGEVRDLARPLEDGAAVAILTDRDPSALAVLRHSSAHLLATAVRQFYPRAKIGFGPPIEDGFYYDFEVPTPFTPDDLTAIEARMREVVAADYPFVREEVSREEAKRRFTDDPLKLERIEDLGLDEVISVYTDGPFVDLCRGPHVASTGKIKHFKLLHAAGAYWRGDERRQMLQRIYGTAWFSKEDLEGYVRRLEEARKRDHRLLGKQLDLFSIQEDVGPGLIFWHPKGAMINFQLRRFIEDVILERGYQLVYTPHVTREQLFLRSGHLPLYGENQFPAMAAGEGEAEDVRYRVKPMNCPMHILVYASQQRSYRDLPIRLAEIANVYRNERSGTLHGMLRVRGLTMDDAHIFLREDQIEEEVFQLLDLTELVLGRTFGVAYRYDLATRPDKKLGTDAQWEVAERALEGALKRRGTS
ncbi:MAG: threonine--tRNA ligase, partial [Gemmatimonadales bacterium]